MPENKSIGLVVVGSVGLDTIKTQTEQRENILGGSASFGCAAASFFTNPGMVGVVGKDFSEEYMSVFRHFNIDLDGLQKDDKGDTFKWSGEYEADMNVRNTLLTELNVFADFSPLIPESYRNCGCVFLANIAPELQLNVLSQVKNARFVAADTMDLWINTARESLMKVISRVNLLLINDSEAQELTEERNLVVAGRKMLGWGPEYVVVKKGEHGCIMFSRDSVFVLPAMPLEQVNDPTGAGDSFAGGFMGHLSGCESVTEADVRQALAWGTVTASFAVESFTLDRLSDISRKDLDARMDVFRSITSFTVA